MHVCGVCVLCVFVCVCVCCVCVCVSVHGVVDNEDSVLDTLESMEKLKSAKLKLQPWSDSYWPIYQGILGARYAHSSFPESIKFKDYKDFFLNPVITQQVSSSLDNLSPGEKYDLLVGDRNNTFAKRNFIQGQRYADNANGKVEIWMGICHGWAPAAYLMHRPKNKIWVTSVDGHKIPFYPSDVKALTSFLWANNRSESRFVGGRCNIKAADIKKDSNGRVDTINYPKLQACFDNNPGTWHMAVVNQIGVSKRSLVMDATFDFEVWNHPIYSYDYIYFNPSTGKVSDTIAGAKVRLVDFTADKFARYRSGRKRGEAKAVSVVGIGMKVLYTVETLPNHNILDKEKHDALDEVVYLYDLELDASNKIIGGEWYTNKHPDFLWTPPIGTKALSTVDHMAIEAVKRKEAGTPLTGYFKQAYQYAKSSWDGSKALPRSWQVLARAQSKEDQVLEKIVSRLVDLSNLGITNRPRRESHINTPSAAADETKNEETTQDEEKEETETAAESQGGSQAE